MRYLTEREARAENLSYTADWSEEAIPERDPSYLLSDAEYPTVGDMPIDLRASIAAQLIDLGMPAWRARAAAEL